MFVIIGILIVLGSIVAGYTMHGGQLMVLFQITEFIIIGGAAVGSLIIANPLALTMRVIKGSISTLKGTKLNKQSYVDLLKLLYDLFQVARREGVIGLEPHIENPESSAIFGKYPSVANNHHAMDFLCDTVRTILSGNIPAHDLEELMEKDLETVHTFELMAPSALTTLSDAFPGLGIVAAVLGVVITMGKIDQPPEIVGHSVAAALVGTFLGILLSYGMVGPIAKNLEHMINAEGRFLQCVKAALLSFAKGAPPQVAIEYARRSIAPDERPSFKETETAIKEAR